MDQNIINGRNGSFMDCKFCNLELIRKNWCNNCRKPQIDASEVIWTDKTCRMCYSTGATTLNELSPYCFDCRLFITQNENFSTLSKTNDDGVVHKSIRWLQSWFFADGITSNSAYLYWRSPKYKNEEYKILKYLVLIKETSESFVVSGDTLSLKLINLNPGTLYNVKLEAIDYNEEIIKQYLKASFTTASL